MFFPKECRSLLRKTALQKYAHKKVTKVQRGVDCWGNIWGYKLTVEGLQTRTLNKNQAKHCEDYANFVYVLNVEQYVKDNVKS